jgi:thiol-disulfide isomerase/thioredoxin
MKYFLIPALMVLVSNCTSKEPLRTGLEGKVLPDFAVLRTDGVTYFNTSAISKEHPFVLLYFSPYCPYCRAQVAEIIDGMKSLKDLRFFLLTSFSVREMKSFSVQYNLDKYPNILVGKDTADFAPKYFQFAGVPYMAIYGKNKTLKSAFIGKVSSNQIEKVCQE